MIQFEYSDVRISLTIQNDMMSMENGPFLYYEFARQRKGTLNEIFDRKRKKPTKRNAK